MSYLVNHKYLKCNLEAIHINHNLHSQALKHHYFCQDLCKKLMIDYKFKKITINNPKCNIENQARIARYSGFKELIDNNSILLTAHTKNDQIETLFLSLIKGNFKSINANSTLFDLKINRPLLNFTKNILKKWLLKHNYKWCEDPTNQDNYFARNYIRNIIIPNFKQKWSNIENALTNAVQLSSDLNKILENQANNYLEKHKLLKTQYLSLPIIKDNFSLSKLILQKWLKSNQIEIHKLSGKQIELILNLQNTICAKMITAINKEQILILTRSKLYLIKGNIAKIINENSYHNLINIKHIWQGNSDLKLPTGILSSNTKFPDAIIIKYRQGGERAFVDKTKNKSLKKIIQEKKIPEWQSKLYPLLIDSKSNYVLAIGNILLGKNNILKEYNIKWKEL